MRTATLIALACTLAGCATTKTMLEEARYTEPVEWPVGEYDVAGHVAFQAKGVSLTSHNRTYHATLIVGPGNVVQLVENDAGYCGPPVTVTSGRTGFGCGGVVFSFTTDGSDILGTVSSTVTYSVDSGLRQCVRYETDAQGIRRCARWSTSDREGSRQQRLARGSGLLHVSRRT